jgi:hypothetical protein
MSRLGNNGSGKTDWYGSFGSLLAGLFSGEIAVGLDVAPQSSPNMTVKVNAGIAAIPTGTDPNKTAYLVRNDTSAGESVTIPTANSSNPRRDIIVAYYDVAVVDTTNPNNPGALKFAAVSGTAAASPADPSASIIQAAVGASNPYIVLARVQVGTGVTQITSANITDLRKMLGPKLPPGTTRLGINKRPSTGSTLTTSYVTLCTVTATSTGKECEAEFFMQLQNANSGSAQIANVQVLCDGVLVDAVQNYQLSYSNLNSPALVASFIVSSTPAAGQHTWTLQAKASANSAVALDNSVLKVAEVV